MLNFATQMTIDVHSIDAAYMDRLRGSGLTDDDLLNTAQVAGFFNYYTRLADALGIEPEDVMVNQRKREES